ncbi:uncharacterized protein LOC130165133 isoform X4 [Seriola aureovittata]|uniref:uncharacterized protein LOC130165133 isoform X4 n=1 Tax=Seriola aureovittata TaxID=2871759 RepID=UPI0024BDFB89|nr:uncharacterized protein LOC130165133 isoform X4 [Seriola aureovittata]
MLQTFRKCAAYGLCSLSSLHADHFELQHQITNATRSHHSRLKYVPPPGDQDRHRPAHRSNSSSSPLALTCPSHRKLAATHHKRRITAQSAGLSSDRRLEHTSPGTLHLLFGAPPSHVQLTGPDAAGHTSAGLCLFQQLETKTERRGLELLSGASQKGKRARRGLEDWFCLATPLGVTCHTLTTAGRRRRLFLNITLNCVKTVTVCRAASTSASRNNTWLPCLTMKMLSDRKPKQKKAFVWGNNVYIKTSPGSARQQVTFRGQLAFKWDPRLGL